MAAGAHVASGCGFPLALEWDAFRSSIGGPTGLSTRLHRGPPFRPPLLSGPSSFSAMRRLWSGMKRLPSAWPPARPFGGFRPRTPRFLCAAEDCFCAHRPASPRGRCTCGLPPRPRWLHVQRRHPRPLQLGTSPCEARPVRHVQRAAAARASHDFALVAAPVAASAPPPPDPVQVARPLSAAEQPAALRATVLSRSGGAAAPPGAAWAAPRCAFP